MHVFRYKHFGILALAIGVITISFSPLLVQISEVGPTTTAAYRMLFAIPALIVWTSIEHQTTVAREWKIAPRQWSLLALGGILFSGDLIAWHSSIKLSGVANATFLAHLSTPIIALGAWLIFNERLNWRFLCGLTIAMVGTALIMGASTLQASGSLLGDGLGLLTAFFYGAYLLTIKQLRSTLPSGIIMLATSIFCLPALLIAAFFMEDQIVPDTWIGWGILFGMGLIIHSGGQGLITVAFKHISASFSSVALLATPVFATIFAWLILKETLSYIQAFGCSSVLLGIAVSQYYSPQRR